MFEFFIEIIKSFLNQGLDYWFTLFFLIVLCVFLKLIYPKFRGFMGEFWVKTELELLDKKAYVVLNDIMIKDDFGTHQIDHLIISNCGIFVIEMKNYFGLITGNEYDNKWTQHLGKNKYYFKNPIHQNYGHVKSLSKLLNLDESYFIPIICISNQAKNKTKTKSIVVYLNDLIKTIKSFENNILDGDIFEIGEVINKNNIKDKKERKEHVQNIRNKVMDNTEKENKMICPKCGSKLVERSGKYGKFVGCSNYPKCRYIKK